MGWLSRLTEWIRIEGQKDSATGHLIQFTYRLFANTYIQAITSILGTVIIGVLIGIGSYGRLFWICVVLYVVFTLLIAWANNHIQNKIRDTKTFQSALYGMGATMRSWAISLQKAAKYLKNTKEEKDINILKQLGDTDFQSAAFAVCQTLSSYLSKSGENDDVYVTVYQRINRDSCKMIAHSADHEVSNYGIEYPIPAPSSDNLFGKIEYHSYVFYSGKKEITSFHTHEQVMKAFVIHGNSEEREGDIQQYICIPISPAKLGVTFLLQVDTNVPNFFGDNEKAVNDFAKNIIFPYAQFLHMVYEQSRMIEQLVS